ncbi:hypothetical protein TNIN_358861 [Trichonephila inaurata madagascariensis]|uniref:DUF5641 domain-containing protein n=1 Tax=Trichonephila inaurata madagascariensis TaxID=2747483 RepID=A0A8X6XXH2_9ARAC|nr:hypothetical protein TNIN_358861 [Trichonephila inaurata madagascariensis]
MSSYIYVEKYCIIKARKTVRNYIRPCVKCQRFTSKRCDANPGILPNDRDLARVEKLIPARDGQIGLAVIKTANSEFLRPVQRLFRLDTDSPVLSVAVDSTSVITKSSRLAKPPVHL